MQKLKVFLRDDGPSFESISQHLERAFGPPVRRLENDYAMARSEEFLDYRNAIAHYGKTKEYIVRRHGSDIGQVLTIKLRDDCEITKSA
jgi:hypothetical protein